MASKTGTAATAANGPHAALQEHAYEPDFIVEAGDVLVLAGEPTKIRNIRHLGPFALIGVGWGGTPDDRPAEPGSPGRAAAANEPLGNASFGGAATTTPLPPPLHDEPQEDGSLPKGVISIPMQRKPAPFASVVVADEAHGVGQRLGGGSFSRHYGASVIACRTRGGEHLTPFEMAMHTLHAGDALVIRAKQPFLQAYAHGPTTEFYVVEPLGFSIDSVLAAKYVRVPEFVAKLGCLAGSTRVESRGGQHFVRLPDWWANLTFVAFFAVVAVAMAEQDLLLGCAVAVIGMVVFLLVTVKEAVNYVDWNVYVTGSMAFGIGSAMSNSGLAAWCGQLLVDAGVEGFWMMFVLALITSLIANIVSNRGAIQVMFPIAVAIVKTKGHDLTPYAVTIANAAMGGFITPYGLSPSLIIAGPGSYTPRDFIAFGTPLLIVYTFLSALFTSIVYDFW